MNKYINKTSQVSDVQGQGGNRCVVRLRITELTDLKKIKIFCFLPSDRQNATLSSTTQQAIIRNLGFPMLKLKLKIIKCGHC